jgi:hypothetical protein
MAISTSRPDSPSRPSPVDPAPAPRPIPGITKFGAVTIAFGLLFDTVEHGFVTHSPSEQVGAFPLGEHLAHFIVLLGMVLVLGGVVADGVRSQRRLGRHQGGTRDALR